jgi:hypothetical protein
LESALGYSGETGSTVLQTIPEPLDVTIVMKERAEAKAEAERHRPGFTIHTVGSRTEVRHPGQKWLRKARPDIIVEIRWCPAH